MKLTNIRWTLPCALALLMPAAFAQGAADVAQPRPKTEAPATTTALEFNSTFTGYRAYTEQAVGSWRDANDEVGRIGGWRAYAREAGATEAIGVSPAPTSAPTSGQTTAPTAAPTAAPDHSKHGRR